MSNSKLQLHAQYWGYVERYVPTANRSLLGRELDDGDDTEAHMIKIAKYLINWEVQLQGLLELTREEVHDIKEGREDDELKRRKLLSIWKNKKGLAATYGLLINCCLEGGNTRAAQKICEILARCPAPSQDLAASSDSPLVKFPATNTACPGATPMQFSESEVIPTYASVARWKIIIYLVFIFLVLLFDCYFYLSSTFKCTPILNSTSTSLSLPVLRQPLIGREEETDIIMNYLADIKETDVVILYGQAGFGKSEIALHVGHKMLERGVDVHYIRVEDYADVASLEQVLMSISGATYNDTKLMRWAKSLRKRTLLILDNVDGPNWVNKKILQSQFVDKLLSHSKLLQVLITSQEDLWSTHKFHSHQLTSLSLDNCVLLVKNMTTEGQDQVSKELCLLVGNVPMAIKVLTAIPGYSLKYVIEKLNVSMPSKKLEFMASAGERVDKDRIISAIKLAFESIEPQHKICSMLLATLPGSFTINTLRVNVTLDMMEGLGFHNFDMNNCLISLASKSFLAQKEWSHVNNNAPEIKESYHFHELIKDFLNTPVILGKYNVTELRNTFLKNYLNLVRHEWTGQSVRVPLWLELKLVSEQSQALVYKYDFATVILNTLKTLHPPSRPLYRIPEYFQSLVDIFVLECKTADLEHFVFSRPSQVIHAYYILMLSTTQSEKNVILCQQKVEQLLVAAAKSEDDLKEATIESAFFHSAIGWRYSSWKYLLISMTLQLATISNPTMQCLLACTHSESYFKCPYSTTTIGMSMFTIKDAAAIYMLHTALDDTNTYNCKELHDAIVYITLYVIYERQGDQQGMKESIAGILDVDFQHSNMAWYYYVSIPLEYYKRNAGILDVDFQHINMNSISPLYSRIIFPFLTQVTNVSMRSHGIERDRVMQQYLKSPSPRPHCPITQDSIFIVS